MGSQLITRLICRDNQLIYTYVHTARQFRVISFESLPAPGTHTDVVKASTQNVNELDNMLL